jgi:hypothetical protein
VVAELEQTENRYAREREPFTEAELEEAIASYGPRISLFHLRKVEFDQYCVWKERLAILRGEEPWLYHVAADRVYGRIEAPRTGPFYLAIARNLALYTQLQKARGA